MTFKKKAVVLRTARKIVLSVDIKIEDILVAVPENDHRKSAIIKSARVVAQS